MRTSRRRLAAVALGAGLVLLTTPGCADGSDEPVVDTTAPATTTTTIPVLSPDAIPVLRAAGAIPAGTEARAALDAGLIEATTVPRSVFPEDGVVTIELIEGRYAVSDLAEGTVLSLAMFVDDATAAPNATTPAEAGVVSE